MDRKDRWDLSANGPWRSVRNRRDEIANSRHDDSVDSSGAIQNSPERETIVKQAGQLSR